MNAPYVGHSETSRMAAERIECTSNSMQTSVLRHLFERGSDGATDEEIQVALKMNPSTQRPRRRELQIKGLVYDSGRRRHTASGRSAVVWVHSEH